jgi:hypothetical protein
MFVARSRNFRWEEPARCAIGKILAIFECGNWEENFRCEEP